jgi:hypothetical protein
MPGYRSGGASLPDVAPAGYNGHVSAARLVEAASQLQALMDCRVAAGLGPPVVRAPPFLASPAGGAAPSPFERLRFPGGCGAAAQRLQPDTPAVERAGSHDKAAPRGSTASADVAEDMRTAGPESSGATFGEPSGPYCTVHCQHASHAGFPRIMRGCCCLPRECMEAEVFCGARPRRRAPGRRVHRERWLRQQPACG